MEENRDTGTAWNMAIATLQRIDNILTAITVDAADFKLSNWLIGLKSLKRELWPWLNDKEKKKIKEDITECDKKIYEFSKEKPKSFAKGKYPDGLYDKLDELDLYIRTMLKVYHFLLPEKSDPSHAMRE